MAGRLASIVNLLRTNPVQSLTNEKAFAIDFGQNRATVYYESNGDVYDLVHSEIPAEFHGQGLGSILAERVFDHLVQSNKKFRLSCKFLRHFYQQNQSRYKSNVVD